MKLRSIIIKEAIKDFFGADKDYRLMPMLMYMTKQKRPKLTEKEKDAVWHIKTNLSDKDYRENLVKSLGN